MFHQNPVSSLIYYIQQGLALWGLAIRRMAHEWGLTLALLVGWLAAVALISAIPIYIDAVNQALLREELQTQATSRRPAFGFLFISIDNRSDAKRLGGYPLRWDGYLSLRQYLQTRFPNDLGLPVQTRMHYAKSDLFQFFPVIPGSYGRGDQSLGWIDLGFIAGIEDHLTLVEGTMPTTDWTPGEPVPILVHQSFATERGLQVGETYALFNPAVLTPQNERSSFTLLVRIVGIWQAQDAKSPFWYISPAAFVDTLLVPSELYISRLGTQIPRPLFELGWYELLNGDSVRAENVADFLQRLSQVETQAEQLLPEARLTLSPASALLRYQVAVSTQAVLILLLGLPVIGLILLFIALTANSMVERQQVEISILKSRGSSSWQIIMTYLLQGITLAILAFVLGLPLGRWAANAIGTMRQFLALSEATPAAMALPLSIAITRESQQYAVVALGLALLVTLIPAYRAARLTIVAAKQTVGRPSLAAVGVQILTDSVLVAVAVYGYFLLQGQGQFATLTWLKGTDLWENPLLFLTPCLFLLAGTRLYLLLVPLLLKLTERILAAFPGITMLLSIRGLTRQRQQYRSLLALLILTAGLGTFVTSVAQTLDDNLVARIFYQVGAQIAVVENAGRYGNAADAGLLGRSPAQSTPDEEAGGRTGWAIPPVEAHKRIAGVQAVARIGRFSTNVRVKNRARPVELYGVDRIDFPQVAYFRPDFAAQSLGSLMNALALEFSGILVQQSFLNETLLQVGDTINLHGLVVGSSQAVPFKIVGTVDLFPTAYPSDTTFFIANLEYIFTQLGGPVPYHVWLSVDDTLDATTLETGLEALGFEILKLSDARAQIAIAQTHPERIGLFGFFSLGFMVTTLLSILALATHAFLMYQRRFIQLGILRALGLSPRQVAFSLTLEQTITTSLGILGGALLGLLTSRMFIPFMQLGYTEADLIPPFVVVIAWREVMLGVIILIIASSIITTALAWILSRLYIFQAIKLGESLG